VSYPNGDHYTIYLIYYIWYVQSTVGKITGPQSIMVSSLICHQPKKKFYYLQKCPKKLKNDVWLQEKKADR
jgi:hypothetical protein